MILNDLYIYFSSTGPGQPPNRPKIRAARLKRGPSAVQRTCIKRACNRRYNSGRYAACVLGLALITLKYLMAVAPW